MDKILNIFIGLLLLSVFFWFVESTFAANPEQPRGLKRRGLRTDLIYWFATPILTRTITQIGLAMILVAIYQQNIRDIQTMLLSRDTLLSRQPLPLQAIEMIVLGDLIAYWIHRAFHGRKLWRFHAIHHSSVHLDWLSSVRLHPVNDWVSRWIQASTLVLVGFSPIAVAAYVPFLTFYAIFVHANVSWGFGPFERWLASPRFHRWHHTSQAEGQDKNFAGLLPLWDVLFGTYYMPKGALPQQFGVSGEVIPEGFLAQMAYPFRRRHPSNETTEGLPKST